MSGNAPTIPAPNAQNASAAKAAKPALITKMQVVATRSMLSTCGEELVLPYSFAKWSGLEMVSIEPSSQRLWTHYGL